DDSVTHYNRALSHSLDSVAPLITRSVSFSSPAPWFTAELRAMKAKGRRLERYYKKSSLTIHQLAYKNHVKSYKDALSMAKNNYYATLIGNQQHHPKQLFSTINRLLCPPDPPQPSDAAGLCSRFLVHFQEKVETIHQQLQLSSLSQSTTLPLSDTNFSTALAPQDCLSSFSPLNTAQVFELVSKAKATTCKHDPMPTALVKACLPTLGPTLVNIINTSLSSGMVPTSFKTAVVIPKLKKPGLNQDDLNHYRPISNLPFISKLLERAVASQLNHHMLQHNLYEPFQSGFRTHHSTETALIKITNDLHMAADSGHVSILILLDLSAAFDTVSHPILLTRLSELIGLTGTVYSWFKSYLTDRQQYVTLKGICSNLAPVLHGVPQGSVLGPLLFNIYMLPLGMIVRKHGLHFHCYADDTQLYISTKPSTSLPPVPLTNCLKDIKHWLDNNLLKLNKDKTELMVFAPLSLLKKVDDFTLDVDGCSISASPQVRNLGVIMDSTLSFQQHIKNVTKIAFYHLKNISRLRQCLTNSVAEALIHSFITSRLDYCNGILLGLPSKATDRLQYVQNSAARMLTRTKLGLHITPILTKLHWLPVKSRIKYKILLLTYKSLHGLAPQYIIDLLHSYTPSRSLRSSDKNLLVVPKSRLKTFGDRAFCVSAPSLWNKLPHEICSASSLSTFKNQLKTHLFTEAFGL
ncbi:hypothetical protein F2P79_023546, partial [Pimephales promelas]